MHSNAGVIMSFYVIVASGVRSSHSFNFTKIEVCEENLQEEHITNYEHRWTWLLLQFDSDQKSFILKTFFAVTYSHCMNSSILFYKILL